MARPGASLVLLALACVAAALGTVALYARGHLFEADNFADEATSALENDDVRALMARAVTEEVVEKADPDLITARPLIEAAAEAVIDTAPFRGAYREGVVTAHRIVFEGSDRAVFRIANVGVLVEQTIKRLDPALARRIPSGLDASLIDLSKDGQDFTDAAQVAEDVRVLGHVLPLLALALLGASIGAAPARRQAVVRAGTGLALTGLLLVVLLFVARELALGQVGDDLDREAAAAVWDAFLGELGTWALLLGGLGVVVAVATSSLLRPVDLDEPLRLAWRWIVREPETAGGRAAWAASLAAVGVALVADASLVFRLVVVVLGAALIARALTALLAAISLPEGERASAEDLRRLGSRALVRIAWVAALAAAVIVGVLAFGDGGGEPKRAAVIACNGSRELCGRSLDEVVFPATHNSYAGADYPGFVFPEQEGTITEQLEAGVRGLWIDTYYGIPGRRVYTDTDRIDPALDAEIKKSVGPKLVAAAARIRADIARPEGKEDRIYLCHAYCELGAVEAENAFAEINAFLDANPGEVLLIDLEDYTRPSDTVKVIEASGLAEHVYRGPVHPMPTLREMVDSGKRVLIGVEHRTGDAPPWYRRTYSFFQETPYDFSQVSELASPSSCRPNRGHSSNPLLLLNNWVNTDPTPRPSAAAKVNGYDFLLRRARTCRRRRGVLPNALNVDFFGEGDVFEVARTLNGLGRKG